MTSGGGWDQATVGPYRLVSRLGEGGMGVVHLGVGPDDRAVAVKVLQAHIAADQDARRRLGREVASLRRVRHARVAEVLDADVDGQVPYLVTRFVPGRTLDDHVRERGPMPLERVVHTGRLLAEALRSIHAAGVVHRDVKPANVMLVDDAPVLIDFGIAHVADESRITVTGLVMGTPGYLSPEVVGGNPVTPATDWWGWGGTLAFAATGRSPFGTGPIEVVLDRVRRGAADLDGLDPRLQSVVSTALAADPQRRPPGDWLVGALESVLVRRGTPSGGVGAAARIVLAAPGPAAPTVRTPPPAVAPAAAPTVAQDARAAARSTVPHGAVAPTVPHRPMPTLADRSVGQAPGSPASTPQASGAPSAAGPGAGAVALRPSPATPDVGPPDAPPRERPTTLLVAGLVALCAMAAVAPGGALVTLFGWMVVARTADRSALAIWRRRYAYGPRSSDVGVTLLAVPWRAAVAVVMSLLALVLPLLVAGSVAFLAGAAQTGDVTAAGTPTRPAALALSAAAAAVTAWWGPGGGSMRRGTTWLGRLAVRRRGRRIGVLVFLGFVVLAALLVLGNGSSPDFAPFQDPPPLGG